MPLEVRGSNKKLEPVFNHLASDVTKSEQFRNLSAEGKPLAVRVSLGAVSLAELGGYSSLDTVKLMLLGQIAPFAIAQEELNTLRANDPGDRARKSHLLENNIIPFNHLVKDLIDRDHDLSFKRLLNELTEQYARMHMHNPKWFQQEASAALNGMRHEIAYERILGELHDEGVSYDGTTIKDELEGTDYFVTYKGFKLPIDVKASEWSRDERRKKSNRPELIVWSQFKDQDFQDGFHIPQELAFKQSHRALDDIEYAADMQLLLKQQTS